MNNDEDYTDQRTDEELQKVETSQLLFNRVTQNLIDYILDVNTYLLSMSDEEIEDQAKVLVTYYKKVRQIIKEIGGLL